jgi:hypothetical protein
MLKELNHQHMPQQIRHHGKLFRKFTALIKNFFRRDEILIAERDVMLSDFI